MAGPARDRVPWAASRRLTTIPAGPEPGGYHEAGSVADEIAGLRALARRDGVHTAALALDPLG